MSEASTAAGWLSSGCHSTPSANGLAPARRDDALPELVHPLVVMRLHGHALAPRGARRERAGLESDLVLRKRSRFGLVAAVTELVG